MTWLSCLLACAPAASDPALAPARSDDTAVASEPDTGGTRSPGLRPLATVSGTCPDLVAPGEQWLESAGVERRVVVLWPEPLEPDTPLLVFFHGRFQDPEEIIAQADLRRVVDEAGIVVAVPHSLDPNGQSWAVADPGPDVTLFDDLRTCLHQGLAIDETRVHVGGYSGGGLFTTWLLQVRGDALASVAPFSGGIEPEFFPYATAPARVPAVLTWGGPDDSALRPDGIPVFFEQTTSRLSEGLLADGHLVAHCVHDGGHRVPGAAPDILTAWVPPHRFGEPSPFRGGLVGFPSLCELIDPGTP